ncbi:MAG: hypothetical protein PHS82_11570 [Lachnospiraceae bacterium]|nr:hypothetical protein [Lachnospiraceae bacterium]
MQALIDQLKIVPDYVKMLFTEHLILAVIALVLFLFCMFFTNKVSGILRNIMIVAMFVIGAFGVVRKNWPQVLTLILALLALIIIRTIRRIIVTIRLNRRNARIEERALAKAAKRRGSWKNKQGYSGERKPIVDPEYKPEKMEKEEIQEVIEFEKTDLKHVKTEAPTEELTPAAAKKEVPASNDETAAEPEKEETKE